LAIQERKQEMKGKNMKKLLWIVIASLILLISAFPALAQGDGEGKVVLGGTFTLKSGEALDGDLVVLRGDAILEEDSLLRGDMAVLGGRATVAGEIDGDVVVFGGKLELKETARIEGQLVNFGAQVKREQGAVIRGGEVIGPLRFNFRGLWAPHYWSPSGPREWLGDSVRMMLAIVWGVAKALGRAVVLTILGLLIVLFWPEHTQRVGSTIVSRPLPSLGVGILTLAVAFCVGLVLIIAACSGLLIWLVAAMAWIFGWTAAGLMVGQRVLVAFNAEPTPPLAAIVGVALISLVWAFPCLGTLFALIVGSAGLGAVVLTRAGTQPYPPLPLAQTETSEGEES